MDLLFGPGITGVVVVMGLAVMEVAKTVRAKRNGGPIGFTQDDRNLLVGSSKAHVRTTDVLERLNNIIIRMDERSKK